MKKLRVNSIDGRRFTGTAKDVVLQMARQDFIAGGKLNYMKEVKERLRAVYNIEITFKPKAYKTFLNELEKNNIISFEKPNKK